MFKIHFWVVAICYTKPIKLLNIPEFQLSVKHVLCIQQADMLRLGFFLYEAFS
jgi:hypothetical protein